MTDRELLELAAKAAGIELISWTNMYDACDEIGGRFITRPRGEPWNPLEDDGDALRLAVKLNMRLDLYTGAGAQCEPQPWCYQADYEDKAAAVRRCIVRAAASIGPTP